MLPVLLSHRHAVILCILWKLKYSSAAHALMVNPTRHLDSMHIPLSLLHDVFQQTGLFALMCSEADWTQNVWHCQKSSLKDTCPSAASKPSLLEHQWQEAHAGDVLNRQRYFHCQC